MKPSPPVDEDVPRLDADSPMLTGLDVASVARLVEASGDLALLVDGEGAVVTRLRHRVALEAAQARLARIGAERGGLDFELAAEDLRGAVAALAGLVGTVGTEDVLGAIFARFCIGK